jgi:hypothetical protein
MHTIIVVTRYHREENKKSLRALWTLASIVWFSIFSVIPPLGVLLWLALQRSVFEWACVMSLFGYFFPYFIEFFFLEPVLHEEYEPVDDM